MSFRSQTYAAVNISLFLYFTLMMAVYHPKHAADLI